MNINKFASLVSWLTHITGNEFTVNSCNNLSVLIEDLIEPAPAFAPQVNSNELDHLLALMQEGTRKIEAIKSYRMLTGAGLKESKDAVEKYWVPKFALIAPLTSDYGGCKL